MAVPKANPARRNVSPTAATLTVDHDVQAPPLPAREVDWNELTVAWWEDIWASPMAPEFLSSDLHGLFLLADLVDLFWSPSSSARDRILLAAEIRQQRQCFGLTPIDRRRLQWTIEKTDEAQDRGKRRRAKPQAPAGQPVPGDDPRNVLRLA